MAPHQALAATVEPGGDDTARSQPRRHDGLLVEMSTGVGLASDFERKPSTATRTDVRLGGTFLFGGAALVPGISWTQTSVFSHGYHHTDSGGGLALSGFLTLYPVATSGLHVRVSPGLGVQSGFFGPTLTGAVGYGWWAGDELTVGGVLDATYVRGSQTSENARDLDHLCATLSLALTYH